MASIPSCAAYQASHIHAQMRRQPRARHLSSASTDSTQSDCSAAMAPALAPLVIPGSQQATSENTKNISGLHSPNIPGPASPEGYTGVMRDHMDRVSQWLTDGLDLRKWIPPYKVLTSSIRQHPDPDKSTVPSKSEHCQSTSMSMDHMVKSED